MKYSKFKRITAAVMAVFMLLPSLSAYVADAAVGGSSSIDFVSDDDTRNTTIVELEGIDVQASLPNGYKFDKKNPFKITAQGGNVVPDSYFTITEGTGTKKGFYTITANAGSANKGNYAPGISGVSSYILSPNMSATMTGGAGSLYLINQDKVIPNPDPTAPPGSTITKPVPPANKIVEVTNNGEIQIITKSTITFEATSPEVLAVNGKGGDSPKFGKATATGDFRDEYNNSDVAVKKFERSGGNCTLEIGFTGGGSNTKTFTMKFQMGADEAFDVGSKFTITYDLQSVNTLILSIISPMSALNSISQGIDQNPTDPEYTDRYGDPYIKLKTGDMLTAVTANFWVLKTIANFNIDPNTPRISMEWEWIPTDPKYQKVVTPQSPGRLQSMYVVPEKEDVKGRLAATPTYTLREPYPKDANGNDIKEIVGKKVEQTITILGTGTGPSIVPGMKTMGGASETAPDISVPLLTIPTNLDVYKYNRTIGGTGTQARQPFQFTATMLYGSGRGRVEEMVISVAPGTNDKAMKLYLGNSPIAYKYGEKIVNTDPLAGQEQMKFEANQKGQVTLIFDYYVRDNNGKIVKSDKPDRRTFIVDDTKPRDFAELSEITLSSPELVTAGASNPDLADIYPNGRIGFGFQSSKYMYDQVPLPNKAATVVVIPRIPSGKGISNLVEYEVTGGDRPLVGKLDMNSLNDADKQFSFKINLEVPMMITLTVVAENGRKQQYTVPVTRMPPSTDSALKALEVTDEDKTKLLTNFVPGTSTYDITVPYSTRWVKVIATTNSPWATVTFDPTLKDKDNQQKAGDWLSLTYPDDPMGGIFGGSNAPKTTELKIKSQAEDLSQQNGKPVFLSTYNLKITRKDPSVNNSVASIKVKNQKGADIAFEGGVQFDKNIKSYKVRIPYSNEKMTLTALPEDLVAQTIKVKLGAVEQIKVYEGKGQALSFDFDVPVSGETEKIFRMVVSAQSEKGEYTPIPYVIEVTRNDPDADSALASLVLQDQNNAAIPTFSYNPQTTDYSIDVSFKVDTVLTIPTPRSPLAKAFVNGKEIDSYNKSYPTTLKVGETKTIKVEVYPEDKNAQPKVYTIVVKRTHASTDARLKTLTTTGTEFLPRFDPGKTLYTAKIPEGTQAITFTATPVDPAATMVINGEAVANGTASKPFEPFDPTSKVTIVVTAEDGKTTMTYVVTVTNQNLVPKSNNADLESLQVNYGNMNPKFKPAITEYDVAVKDDVTSVDILPVARDEGAKIKVLAGTKQLGDYSDNYSSVIRDGDNEFTVEVTSEDGKQVKKYLLNIYRKDEEQQGIYKPITPDMVNYEQAGNEIVIDISHYAIVSADVLNTLRDKYPDKTIVFQGNDYTLQVKGKDIAKLIPHDQVFDFSLTFTAPDEEDIWDIIESDGRNNKVDPVFIHFNHHGALPAPMLFTLSLGRQYRNLSATWNYYNEERDRIDFYGGLRTNSRGTFSVLLTHMSTYLFSDAKIVGSENKSGETGDIGSITSGDSIKNNPNTGAR